MVGKSKQEREGSPPVMSMTRLSSLFVRLTSTQFSSIVAMCLSAMVVPRSFRPTTTSTDIRSFLVASLTTGRAFASFTCGPRGEERKKTVLASSRKRADFLYHLNGKLMIWLLKKEKNYCPFLFRLHVRFVKANLS